jgi:site-specific DNA-methyltransferase (adenine-specific)
MTTLPNKGLFYGDNLDWLGQLPDDAVDLIYLDPPFNSDADYNVIFREHQGGGSQAQIRAFGDTWQWSDEAAKALDELIAKHGEVGEMVDLLVRKLGHNSLSAYLVMMAIRLVEMHRVLKPTGSTYLHCDITASHYLKIILDTVFGPLRFKNEIIWQRTTAGKPVVTNLPKNYDTILWYTKSENYTFHPISVKLTEEDIKTFNLDDNDGRGRYNTQPIINPAVRPNLQYSYEDLRGRIWKSPSNGWRFSEKRMRELDEQNRLYFTKTTIREKYYLSERLKVGKQAPNIWADIPIPSKQERLGYPTQKPVALLERIILASTNPGDIVLDPFCGCGTAVVAAENLGRRWVGIDITHLAVSLMQARIRRDFKLEPRKDYQVEGTPEDEEAARFLFESDNFQFQFWAVGLIGAQPYGAATGSKKGKKGGDTGIDGLIYFRTPGGEKLEKGIVSVKGGKNLNPSMVRDLVGTVQREKAAIGVFVSMEEPSKGMRAEAAKAGVYTYGAEKVPKVQVLTIPEILAGKKPQLPSGSANVSLETKTVKTAKTDPKKRNMQPLFGDN